VLPLYQVGIPFPHQTASSSPAFEIGGGLLLLTGLGTRPHRHSVRGEMIVPFSQQKSLCIGNFAIADASGTAQSRNLAVLHEIRADYARFLPRCSIDQWARKMSLDTVLQPTQGWRNKTNPAPRSNVRDGWRINAALQRRRVSTSSSSLPNRIHR